MLVPKLHGIGLLELESIKICFWVINTGYTDTIDDNQYNICKRQIAMTGFVSVLWKYNFQDGHHI